MRNALLNELLRAPLPFQVDVINGLDIAHACITDGTMTSMDGQPLDPKTLFSRYINQCDAEAINDLHDTIKMDNINVVTVSDIQYDGVESNDGEAPDTLTFLLYDNELTSEQGGTEPSDTEIVDAIHAVIDDKISDATGFCFTGCTLSAVRYEPYHTTRTLDLNAYSTQVTA